MYCKTCKKQCPFNMMPFCPECDQMRREGLEEVRDIYESQNECCASCNSYYFLTDCVYMSSSNDVICNRCYKAILFFNANQYNMRNSIPYLKKHGTKKHYRTKKDYVRRMVLSHKLYKEGYRKCSDCRAWMVDHGSYCPPCKDKHAKDLKPYRKKRKEILEQYNYTCEICNNVRTSRQLALDHDHENGEFRGVLCRRCNGAIGLMRDDVTLVEDLERYMKHMHGEPGREYEITEIVKDGTGIIIEPEEIEKIKEEAFP